MSAAESRELFPTTEDCNLAMLSGLDNYQSLTVIISCSHAILRKLQLWKPWRFVHQSTPASILLQNWRVMRDKNRIAIVVNVISFSLEKKVEFFCVLLQCQAWPFYPVNFYFKPCEMWEERDDSGMAEHFLSQPSLSLVGRQRKRRMTWENLQ